jgi:hypothetical protein
MPTENRSSNTEMVSVPRELTPEMLNGVCMHPDLARSLWSALLKNAPQPAEQHQGEPVLIQAVAVTRADGDEGLRLEWLLEGGIAEMEFAGQVLFAMPEANDLCDEDGSAFVHLQPLAADPGELERLRTALKFYADRDHFSEDIGSDWDSVSGEPANILWHEDEAWFVEDGSIARAALSASDEPSAPIERAEVDDALLWLDDFVARCNGDDRGSCSAVETLRAALAARS